MTTPWKKMGRELSMPAAASAPITPAAVVRRAPFVRTRTAAAAVATMAPPATWNHSIPPVGASRTANAVIEVSAAIPATIASASTIVARVRGRRNATATIAAAAATAPTTHARRSGPGTWTKVPVMAAGRPSIVTGTTNRPTVPVPPRGGARR